MSSQRNTTYSSEAKGSKELVPASYEGLMMMMMMKHEAERCGKVVCHKPLQETDYDDHECMPFPLTHPSI